MPKETAEEKKIDDRLTEEREGGGDEAKEEDIDEVFENYFKNLKDSGFRRTTPADKPEKVRRKSFIHRPIRFFAKETLNTTVFPVMVGKGFRSALFIFSRDYQVKLTPV